MAWASSPHHHLRGADRPWASRPNRRGARTACAPRQPTAFARPAPVSSPWLASAGRPAGRASTPRHALRGGGRGDMASRSRSGPRWPSSSPRRPTRAARRSRPEVPRPGARPAPAPPRAIRSTTVTDLHRRPAGPKPIGHGGPVLAVPNRPVGKRHRWALAASAVLRSNSSITRPVARDLDELGGDEWWRLGHVHPRLLDQWPQYNGQLIRNSFASSARHFAIVRRPSAGQCGPRPATSPGPASIGCAASWARPAPRPPPGPTNSWTWGGRTSPTTRAAARRSSVRSRPRGRSLTDVSTPGRRT